MAWISSILLVTTLALGAFVFFTGTSIVSVWMNALFLVSLVGFVTCLVALLMQSATAHVDDSINITDRSSNKNPTDPTQ